MLIAQWSHRDFKPYYCSPRPMALCQGGLLSAAPSHSPGLPRMQVRTLFFPKPTLQSFAATAYTPRSEACQNKKQGHRFSSASHSAGVCADSPWPIENRSLGFSWTRTHDPVSKTRNRNSHRTGCRPSGAGDRGAGIWGTVLREDRGVP